MAGNGTHRPRRWLLPLILVVVTLALATPASPTRTDVLLRDGFDLGLITSEYAYWNPGQGVSSPTWEMTSGSLFSRGGRGWTGVPDTCSSLNAGSTSCTNSAVFRLNTKSYAFGNATVSFDLVNNSLVSTAATPAVAWDGVHIFLRYQSQYSLYYASVNRRDGYVVIKKKCPGGPTNGGAYYNIGSYLGGHPIPFGQHQQVSASILTNQDGSVTITVARDGIVVDKATDGGVGCAPITHLGAVGIRGDNDDFTFDNFVVGAT